MNFKEDKKYIISLEKRADRRYHIAAQIQGLKLNNFHFFIGIDGKNISYHGKLKKGQNGCKLSHLEIIKKAKEEKLPHVIIIEDDAVFTDLFSLGMNKLALPLDWDMFYFGAHNFRQLNNIENGIGRCVTTLSTVCYAVHSRIYDLLIKELQRDEILDIIYCNIIHPKVNAYCAFPNLVVQGNGFSDIENVHVDYKKFYQKWQ